VVLVLTSAFVRSAVEAEIGRPCVTTRQRQPTQISISLVIVKYLLQHLYYLLLYVANSI
jgi:hypothetical protein